MGEWRISDFDKNTGMGGEVRNEKNVVIGHLYSVGSKNNGKFIDIELKINVDLSKIRIENFNVKLDRRKLNV